MSNALSITVIILAGLLTGLIMALALKKQGYSFMASFVKGCLAGSGISGIIVKVLRDYL